MIRDYTKKAMKRLNFIFNAPENPNCRCPQQIGDVVFVLSSGDMWWENCVYWITSGFDDVVYGVKRGRNFM